jgi:hypothetical protein
MDNRKFEDHWKVRYTIKISGKVDPLHYAIKTYGGMDV